jgi:hypothetical protein
MKLTITIIPDERETGENLAVILRKVAKQLTNGDRASIDFSTMEGDSGAGVIELTTGNSCHADYSWKLEDGE